MFVDYIRGKKDAEFNDKIRFKQSEEDQDMNF